MKKHKRYSPKWATPYQLVVTDQDGKVGIDYGVVATPETYLIDQAGVISI